MNASELKYHIEQTGREQYFFTRETMRFFGDTMRNYGVRSATVTGYDGKPVECWELYRRHAVKHGNDRSAYFSKADYQRVHAEFYWTGGRSVELVTRP
jgi:hypothetical protein